MTAQKLVRSFPISQVWKALGGATIRRGRAMAFWRDGDNPNAISLNDEKGSWFDYRDQVGGGVLDLIQHVLNCTPKDALNWLSELTGLPITNAGPLPNSRKRRARAKPRDPELGRKAWMWVQERTEELEKAKADAL